MPYPGPRGRRRRAGQHISRSIICLQPCSAVQIAEPIPESIVEENVLTSTRQFRASSGRKLSGKLSQTQLGGSSRSSAGESPPSLQPIDHDGSHFSHPRHRNQYYSEKLMAQVGEWLENERKKIAGRAKKPRRQKSVSPPVEKQDPLTEPSQNGRSRSDSVDSQSSDVSLDKLQKILEDSMASMGMNSLPSFSPKVARPRSHRPNRASLHRSASSDTDYVDGDVIVPDCDVWIDNSKTLSYTGGGANTSPAEEGSRARRDQHAWLDFKNEIIRTTHTLKLKGWRRVPLGSGDSIEVERLSGALTNAVYVVTPANDYPKVEGLKTPRKLLLRIYGPQVENLIDRETELKVLQRLARKKIGPRLLGTFKNGRFEEYFNASPLTPNDLRDPEVSRQIAKRMRELHDGIELLQHEREIGPSVFKSWDQWFDNVARIVTYLDEQFETDPCINSKNGSQTSVVHAWKQQGYVCGVPWAMFKETMAKYRALLESHYHDRETLSKCLVFAHNDTQYGNILRFKPDDAKSPLLQPANRHKQLIVIDFEYAGANMPGVEFANHFMEWTYNYHDLTAPHDFNIHMYPTPDEQRRFIKAYIDHRPQFPNANTPKLSPRDSASSTPGLVPTPSSNSISDFMLDARAPPGGWTEAEKKREEETEIKIRGILEETRLWRPANSAFWIAWGIVQAKVPGLANAEDKPTEEEDKPQDEEEEEAEDEFDYLSYAQKRALLFWGDCVQMGLVKIEDLPDQLQASVRILKR
ncbi:unnamed protein product [Clonostachys chloroleuca]|uniref:Choline kinase N-terminal domain-containing protein n=1 Tax=Clonostachys chloroleuca TaxID=1926264 RepID=A0AA35Q8T2_9HYPO|nr:unnamed protein product [Clonostachys chloroleuca]